MVLTVRGECGVARGVGTWICCDLWTKFTVRVQVQLQAALVTEADLSRCRPDEQALLLGSRHVPPVLEVWEADVPLVLVDTYYEPLGALPRPRGRPRGGGPEDSNVIWLRPADEAELLASLADAGVVVVAELD